MDLGTSTIQKDLNCMCCILKFFKSLFWTIISIRTAIWHAFLHVHLVAVMRSVAPQHNLRSEGRNCEKMNLMDAILLLFDTVQITVRTLLKGSVTEKKPVG